MLRLTLSVSALYLGLVGISVMLFPVQFGTGAIPPDASPQLLALLRLFGGPLLGVAVLNWLSRNAAAINLREVLLANLVGFGAVTANDLWGIASGESREVAKLFLIAHLLFTAAFAFGLRKVRRAAVP